jgi:hypothetical protein
VRRSPQNALPRSKEADAEAAPGAGLRPRLIDAPSRGGCGAPVAAPSAVAA